MRILQVIGIISCLSLAALPVQGQEVEAKALLSQLDSPDAKTRVEACYELARLGIRAEGALPQLVKSLKSNQVDEQRVAALALASMGEAAAVAVPALADNLTAKDYRVRAAAAYALGKIGPAAGDAVRALIAASADDDVTVQHHVWEALLRVDLPPDVALSLFARALGSASDADAAKLADALGEAGAAAVPELIKAMADNNARYWACIALANIGPSAAPAVEALGKTLGSDEAEVRMQAIVALAEIGAAARPIAPQISKLLENDPWDAVRYAAAYALGTIGDKAAGQPALVRVLSDDDEFLRVTAARSYVMLAEGESSAELQRAVELIAAGLTSADYRVRDVAVRALADPDIPAVLVATSVKNALLGISDPDQLMEIVDGLASLGDRVVPSCVNALQQQSALRFYVIQLLIKLGPAAAGAVDALVKTLDDPAAELRRESLFALGAIGEPAATAVPAITQRLGDQDEDVRRAACYALGKIGPRAAAALPNLQAAMQGDDSFLQLASVWSALQIAPQDGELRKRAIPLLVKGLADEREQVRVQCAYALGDLGPAARPAVSALEETRRKDDSAAVRAAVSAALEQIKS